MNRKTRLLPQLALFLALGTSVTLGSCSDNDLDANSNGGNKDSDTTQVSQFDKHEALMRLLGALADVDSLPDNWNDNNYVVAPAIGVVKDASTPHVRYVVVNNANEADRLYCSYVAETSTGTASNHEWKGEGVGTLKFEVNNQPDLYATLNVNVQQLPALEEVRFVPASAIGDNSGWFALRSLL